MQWIVLALLLLVPVPAFAAEAPQAVTPVVQAEGVTLSARDLIFTDKKAYLHLLWDTFPSKQAVEATAKAQGLELQVMRKRMVTSFLAQFGSKKSKAKLAKVDVVEFPDRDNYGDPVWGSVVKLDRFELPLSAAPKAKAKAAKGKAH